MRGPEPVKPIAPALVRYNLPVPEASMVADAPMVNKRLLLAAAPVYCRVPPLMTRFVAAFDEEPMLLFELPSAKTETASVPPRTEVAQEYVFVALSVVALPPCCTKAPVPLITPV